MSRIFCAFLTLLAIYLTTSPRLAAADKSPKSHESTAAAREQIAAALRAEIAGENDRRAELLASAARTAPDLPDANWHLGRVQIAGKWQTLDDAQQEAANNPQLAEYRKLRDEAADNPKLLRGLARWCVKAGWNDLARLHYAQLLAAPGADVETKQEAIKRLNLVVVDGIWTTSEELAAQRQKAKAIEDALTKWRPRLKRLQMAIDGAELGRREQAIKELQELNDPQIIPVLESFLLDGEDRFQEEAVARLAKFPHYEATQALAHYAVLSSYLSARDKAAAALRGRSIFEYAPILLGGLIAPLKTQFAIADARGGRVMYRHVVQRQTPQANQVAMADTIALPAQGLGAQLRRGPEGTILGRQLVQKEFVAMQNAAAAVEQQASAANSNADSANRRITSVLQTATGEQLGNDPQQWWYWWQDYNQKQWPQVSQYAYAQQQYVYGYVFPFPRAQAPNQNTAPATGTRHSCFVAGTLIHTQLGPRPIETIQPGDRVLSQDQDTGELAYKLISATTVRPPGKLLLIRVGDQNVTTTPGHPFWVDGRGWQMAKELKESDLLHSLRGAVRVDKIEQASEDKAYNLVVDDFNTYFVGQQELLVHDNEFRKPTRAIVPGLTADDDEATLVKK